MARLDTDRHYTSSEVMGPINKTVINTATSDFRTLNATYGKHAKGIRFVSSATAPVLFIKYFSSTTWDKIIGGLSSNEIRGEIVGVSSTSDGTGTTWSADTFALIF